MSLCQDEVEVKILQQSNLNTEDLTARLSGAKPAGNSDLLQSKYTSQANKQTEKNIGEKNSHKTFTLAFIFPEKEASVHLVSSKFVCSCVFMAVLGKIKATFRKNVHKVQSAGVSSQRLEAQVKNGRYIFHNYKKNNQQQKNVPPHSVSMTTIHSADRKFVNVLDKQQLTSLF